MTERERIAREMPLDRVQLEALGVDARSRAHASRLERVRRERETRAADHWAD